MVKGSSYAQLVAGMIAAAVLGTALAGGAATPSRSAAARHKAHPVHRTIAQAAPSSDAQASPDDAASSVPADAATPDDAPLPPAPTGGIPNLRATLSANYSSADAAFSAKDADVLLQPYDPSFQNIDPHGAMNLQSVQSGLASLFDAAKSAASATRILAISPIGKTGAQADIKQHIALLYVDPQTGENSRVTIDNICRDYWQLTDAGWMKTRSRLVSSTRKVTGVQPVLPIVHW